ncbi:membrane protein insertion efficiency factor YidD [Melissococcus plutonius]|uniref:Putative membrane protein insertion efficiency factor n=1 Tax=Melissococcus plutonius (strain ATCC 35311 / DSM 29964 / CIP 104052 / LMG 20360 / NCIMB 702443) TaxID=940190 RepID=F3YA29_MELPT|nr:membrane protein insertion efficiency factor YidD [Melissococcus plutonius]AIM24866.1 putative membrane protein insertion efficiency factor [Melissococcus plutonius S1]KMT24997.1 putative membrane protein insertion efficiency factor [Melissococcus plutonius]KMT26633.1 putative membrane protein insertion efficiency factor [Melissococcus plutonius]KMT27883.1 putative membrane protein insertion efficiency factor [Melissococcus plutonius]KMT29656.1 putative membrane protein insertion efficiency
MKKLLIHLIHFYQRYISPGIPPRCRYYPTCSQYMIDAINIHGWIKGTIMGVARIFCCHPFVKGGIDYVPKKFTIRRNIDEGRNESYNKSK